MEDASRRPVTIAQVATDAGVSVPTVSRVLNGSAPVADETRRRVLESIDRLGYHPNPMARGLSRGRSDTVLVVVPHVTEPSVTDRLGGLIAVLRDTPYELHLVDVELPAADRTRSLDELVAQTRPAAAVIISLPPDDEETSRLVQSATPVVLVDADRPELPGDSIDDVEGGSLATRHLLSHGHRRVAFIGDQEETAIGIPASADRRRGYERTIREAGIALRPDYIRTAPHGTESAAALARELLALDEPPTAIFAASDVQAFGVLQAARAAGVRVPADLSLIGFDDIYAAGLVGLSTVRQPLEASGRRAGLRVLELLGHHLPESMPEMPPLGVVQRQTTGPLSGDETAMRSLFDASAEAPNSVTEVSTALDPAARQDERIPRRK